MFHLRTAYQPAFLRSLAASRPTTSPLAIVAGRRFAHSDYGSGAQKSGEPNNAVDKEHPGPSPPSATKQGGKTSKSSKAPQPKILNENPPAEGEQSEDVARHNREMDQRADRAHEGVKNEDTEKDKVSKGFWTGEISGWHFVGGGFC